MAKTREDGHKFFLGRLQLDTRGTFFPLRTISHCNNHRREAVTPPALVMLGLERLDQMILEILSNLEFCDSSFPPARK